MYEHMGVQLELFNSNDMRALWVKCHYAPVLQDCPLNLSILLSGEI